MKKSLFLFFSLGIVLLNMNTGCKKKSTSSHIILDTITVAGGNGPGHQANEFESIYGLAVDKNKNIYVADFSRIQKWIPGGTAGITIAGDTIPGTTADLFSQPGGIFLDKGDTLYIADIVNYRIQKWIPGADSGITVAGINDSYGSAANQFYAAYSVFVDVQGYIYVTDYGNARVQKFPPNSTSGTNGITIAGGNGLGNAATQLNEPQGLFVDKNGNVYVADGANNRIQKFPPGSTNATPGITVAGGSPSGTAANQLNNPQDVVVDENGYIYVADFGNHRVQKFPPNSTSTTNAVTVAGSSIGIKGPAYNLLSYPTFIYLDSGANNLYISDAGNERIQKWELK
jgi:sugar lactone lactonase YvrE